MRFADATQESLDTLAPHRDALAALIPVLVSTSEQAGDGLAATRARTKVEGVFIAAVKGAEDAPDRSTAEALGRVLYLVHLAVVMWWLLDRSEGQSATRRLMESLNDAERFVTVGMNLPFVRQAIQEIDDLVEHAFG